MAFMSYKKSWESNFDNIVSKRDKLQGLNINQLKVEVHDTYKKTEKNNKIWTYWWIRCYVEKKIKKVVGHISYIENEYNEFKLQYNKKSVQQILTQRAVKTTNQLLNDRGLFGNYANSDKVLEDFFTIRRRENLSDQLNDVVQRVCS